MPKHPKILYSIRVESPRGSDHVELESNKREAHRRAKRLTKETGKRHHVLTLDNSKDDDGLDPLRQMMAV